MAEEKSPPELNIHLLECAICLEQVQQPKTLPCRHYFCQDCLETYIDKELSGKMASATSFPCPVCRRMTSPVNPAKSKNKWAAQFPANALIQDFANVKERSSKPLFCTPCQTKENLTNPASYWCKMMETAFCQNCKLNYHDVIHRRCEMTDISGQVLPSKPENFHPRCDTHDKKMTWYCEDHHILGCSKCMIKNHKACDGVMTATDYIQKLKTGSHLSDMQSMLFKWKEAMESLVRSFDVQLKTMAKNQDIVMQSIADLRKMIDKRLDELQKDVTDKLVTFV
ncbi:tripartite motif-containing protein 2-like isoform X2 [Pecten maximus]|uniref:tripartite motif-containing protein 2-like isoform X2 n=1 Tax=Pecten maximus TaxID=6579 RepID=UPI0014588050|nr:tripartite motif-containing protein 2-like isoform X2 [Pecten maximus]